MEPARILDEKVDGLHHEYRIALDAGQVGKAIDERLRRAGQQLPVPGFRPGRAPLKVLRAHHGRRVRDGVVDQLAIAVTRRLIEERGLCPQGRPSIHIDSNAPETFVLTLEVAPELDVGDLASIPIQRLEVADGDQESTALSREHVRRQLFDALAERYRFPVPETMVAGEHARVAAGYLEAIGEEPDPATDRELLAIAERRIRLALLFAEIARRNDITVSRAEVEQLVEDIADRDPEHQDAIIDYYLDHPTALAELQSPLLEERVVEFLLEGCAVTAERVDEARLRAAVLGPDHDQP